MILTKFLKIAMLHVVLDWQKIYETVLEKALSSLLRCEPNLGVGKCLDSSGTDPDPFGCDSFSWIRIPL